VKVNPDVRTRLVALFGNESHNTETFDPVDRFLPATPFVIYGRMDRRGDAATGREDGGHRREQRARLRGYARSFAAKGATVVMACRSAERAETAADEIRADAGGDIDGELDVRVRPRVARLGARFRR